MAGLGIHSCLGRLPFSSHLVCVGQSGTALSAADIAGGMGWGAEECVMWSEICPTLLININQERLTFLTTAWQVTAHECTLVKFLTVYD